MAAARTSQTSRVSRWVLVLALVLASGACTYPLTAEPPTASSSTDSQTALPESPVVDFFAHEMLNRGAPAVVVQIKVRGREWSQAYGSQDVETGEPVAVTDRIQAGGITQSMVAVSALKLVQEGKLGLEDPVTDYFPEIEQLLHPPGPVTVRSLLNHSSGLPDAPEAILKAMPPKQAIDMPFSIQEYLRMAGTVPWTHANFQLFRYSDANYFVLAAIIEKLRGRPIGDVLDSEIFVPLGMNHTSLAAEPDRDARDMIQSYEFIDGERINASQPEYLVGSPAEGVISTVGDINTFYAALMQGWLLTASTLREMQTIGQEDHGLGLQRWNDECTNGFYYGYGGSTWFASIALSTSDGSRQIAMSFAYPSDTDKHIETTDGSGQPEFEQLREVAVAAMNGLC
ncbi:serine hydrolase domain-containing protein [Arthrobacter bambusae]|uniref:serine hydrolase domain-containing protein n=1 Tax=Arthrobacter bambusae TaxID=1338426 RepID=UPI00278786F0|nr:serine hydrolase [Arthrobacter bambusae]MDQ0031806.1 D-alanyl-D-alanine carboxypeptidase [Arthrobacter bambusae]MDQ0099916.1 D-alanyl-D-alanine carboxypeptidase [Arthrobacter bambusae]